MTSIRKELSAAYHKLFGGGSGPISLNLQTGAPPLQTATAETAMASSPAKSEDCPPLFTVAPMPLTGNEGADQYIRGYNAQVAKALTAKNEERTEKRENTSPEYYYRSTVTENTAAKRTVEISENSEHSADQSRLSLEPNGNLISKSSSDEYPWRCGPGLMFGSNDSSTKTFTRNADGSLREEYTSFHGGGAFDGGSYSLKHVHVIFPDGRVIERERAVKGY